MSDVIRALPDRPGVPTSVENGSAIAATTDAQAISTWLISRTSGSRHTFLAYRKEAARLLLWLEEHRLSLGEMKVEHVEAFYRHLGDPPAHWLRTRKRGAEGLLPTQVLYSPLKAESIEYTRRVLGQMAKYLQAAGYLKHNVFQLSSSPAVVEKDMAERHLDVDSWQWLWAWIVAMPRDSARDRGHAVRARWLFALLYHTGIRREEAANGSMGDFVRVDSSWKLRVVGKGKVERFVTINSVLLQELVGYRNAIGLEYAYPVPGELVPLVSSVNRGRQNERMTPRAIGRIVADVSKSASSDDKCTDPHIRSRIQSMSTHWLRHTNATHRFRAGATLETTQDELGHKDPKTTRIYLDTLDEHRREDAEKLANFGTTMSDAQGEGSSN